MEATQTPPPRTKINTQTQGGTPSPHHPEVPEGIGARILYRSGVFVGHAFRVAGASAVGVAGAFWWFMVFSVV